jgi:hypothetical protein
LLLGDEPRGFQAITPPSITNEGRSAYWSVSRSSYIAWVGEEGLDRWHFNRGSNGNQGFTRNDDFPGTPCFAAPALSSDPAQPVVFGGSAFTEFIRLNYDFTEEIIVRTDSHIMAKAVVDPEDRTVYYAESNGLIHQARFDNIADIWQYALGFGVEGEIALSSNGAILYVADTRGFITALQVAEIPITGAPSAIPSDAPSSVPTKAPVTPTEAPTAGPTATIVASAAPTNGPTATVTSAPTSPDVEMPSTSSTPAPAVPEGSGAAQPMWLVALVGAAACMFV